MIMVSVLNVRIIVKLVQKIAVKNVYLVLIIMDLTPVYNVFKDALNVQVRIFVHPVLLDTIQKMIQFAKNALNNVYNALIKILVLNVL